MLSDLRATNIAFLLSIGVTLVCACASEDDDDDDDDGGNGSGDPTSATEEVCVPYAEHYAECLYDGDPQIVQYVREDCEYILTAYTEDYGTDCGVALEEAFACMAAAGCAAFELDETCQAEWNAMENLCN